MPPYRSQKGTMIGLPASTVYAATNSLYIIAVGVAAICTFLIYQSAAIVLAEEKREFETYKVQAGKDVAAAYAEGVKAGREATEAKAAAAEANARAAEAQQRAAEATAQAEAARLEIARLTSPRHLTAEQKSVLIPKLSSLPKGKIIIGFKSFGPAETTDYGQDIWDVLLAAGFEIPHQSNIQHLMNYSGTGLKVVFHSDAPSRQLAESVWTAFTTTGVEMSLEVDESQPTEQAAILIGPRF